MPFVDLLPASLDLAALGLHADQLTRVDAIYRKDTSSLFRIEHAGQSFVLKWLADAQTIEPVVYWLLRVYGIPTVPCHGLSRQAILLEDLRASQQWRLAEERDMQRPETGRAVAKWYQAFHQLGGKIVNHPAGPPHFLTREVDALTPDNIRETGVRLGLQASPVWQLAAEQIHVFQRLLHSFPETLNYNDFHWTNLALSRQEPLRAIVFDYHVLGIGPAFNDIRNVKGAFNEGARQAFLEAYGPVDERPAIFDAPVSLLYSLYVAARLPALPTWAQAFMHSVVNGELEAALLQAIASLPDMP